MAQATHGSAPDIAGSGRANPYAMIESTRMLLDWLGRRKNIPQAVAAAKSMQEATAAALGDAAARTGDIRGSGNTASVHRRHHQGAEIKYARRRKMGAKSNVQTSPLQSA
jgi:3-isopropylmalate dehydrogenase